MTTQPYRIVHAFSLIAFVMLCTLSGAWSQSLVGTWQLMKDTNCMTAEVDDPEQDESMDQLMSDLNSMSSRTPELLKFKSNQSGEGSTAIIGKKKTTNDRNFLYKVDGTTLYLLDKKSQTILSTHTIDKLTSGELILSNSSRPCEVRVFARIKDGK